MHTGSHAGHIDNVTLASVFSVAGSPTPLSPCGDVPRAGDFIMSIVTHFLWFYRSFTRSLLMSMVVMVALATGLSAADGTSTGLDLKVYD